MTVQKVAWDEIAKIRSGI